MMRAVAWLERYDRALALAGALLALLAGLAYSMYLGETLRFLPDESDYAALTENLATLGIYSLDGSTPSAYRPPGYPLYLLPFRLAGGGVIAYRAANFLALAAALLLLHRLAALTGARLPVLAVGLALAYPVLFFTAGTLYPQTLAAAQFLGVILLLSDRRVQTWKAILAGVLAGWLVLTVPTFALSSGVVLLWAALRRQAVQALLAGLVMASLVTGWSVRNALVFDRLVFVSTNSGENLLLGNSEYTTPNGGRTIDIARYEQAAAGLDEAARDAFYREQAMAYIQAHPAETARMFILKTLNFFNYRNELVTAGEGNSARDLLMLVTYGSLLALFAMRLALLWRVPATAQEWLWIALYLSGALFSAIFFTRIRFRLPYDFLLAGMAAVLLGRLAARPAQPDPRGRQFPA